MGKTYNYSRELNGANCHGACLSHDISNALLIPSLVVFQEGEKSWPLYGRLNCLHSDCLIRPLKVKLPLIRKII